MTKEFEAFENIMKVYGDTNSLEGTYNDFLTIKKALLELKTIKESNPSKAMDSLEYICKILNEKRIDIKWLFKNDYNTIQQTLIKTQELEKENVGCIGGRSFSKEVMYLKQSIEQCNNEPIYYVSRRFGNKYIVPQDKYINFEDNTKLQNKCQEMEKVLEIIKKKDVDIYILNSCKTVEEYNSKIVHIIGETRELTKKEFELLKRWLI